jgi:hypothetical protein
MRHEKIPSSGATTGQTSWIWIVPSSFIAGLVLQVKAIAYDGERRSFDNHLASKLKYIYVSRQDRPAVLDMNDFSFCNSSRDSRLGNRLYIHD